MITFRKAGNFYLVFDDDAYILHSLFKYKINDGRVGFSLSRIDKVVNKLRNLHIDYKLDNIITHFEDNKYDYYLMESKNRISIDYKINEIIEKIETSDYNTLTKLIELIDNFYSYEK